MDATREEEAPPTESDEDLQRELIEFDSEAPAGVQFRTTASASPRGLGHFVDIDWPSGLAPAPGKEPRGESLPDADVLIVTWTVDEGHALSHVLTPGFDSRDDWKPYTKNFAAISADMRAGCPARNAGRLGTYWTTKIGPHKVTLFKSDSHMSQDGPKLPNATVWAQIIQDCAPKWVITTGTGGGIGPDFEVGDVIVSRFVSFDCQRQFKRPTRGRPRSAVLGMVCKQLGSNAPDYTIVRNVSDPEIKSDGLTLRQQTKLAADIYKAFGRWSTVCSAIVCWAIVAGLPSV